MTETEYQHPLMAAYWKQLDTRFPKVAEVFEDVMAEALSVLTREGLDAYLEAGRVIGKLGRGEEPMLAFLEEWPSTAKAVGESALPAVMALIQRMQKSPNGRAIAPFLQTLAPVARRLQSQEQLQLYLDITLDFMERTTGSIHGHHTTFPSPGLPEFLAQAPNLLSQLSLAGLKNWVEYGIRNYGTHPERQKDFFSLQSADSRAVLRRERHGTLLADVEHKLDLYLRGLWQDGDHLVPYSTAFDEIRKPIPYYDKLGIRLPDVYDDLILSADSSVGAGAVQEGAHGAPCESQPIPAPTLPPHPPVGAGLPAITAPAIAGKPAPTTAAGETMRIPGIDRYRAVLAHIVGHRRWSEAQIADNWSPFQRMAVEFFEDCRIETLLIREYPGLRRLFLALHPKPLEGACDPETTSCLRHRMAMLSRALLETAGAQSAPYDASESSRRVRSAHRPDHSSHGYTDPALREFVERFHEVMAQG
ncbi:MAG: hypothetical protein WA108_14335, partial [Thiobacillus sp.]